MKALVLILALSCLVMVGCKKEEAPKKEEVKPVKTEKVEEVKKDVPAPVEEKSE